MDMLVVQGEIGSRIFELRGVLVMLDRDIAQLYGVETRRLNEQVRRNIERFPGDFMFQLSEKEKSELVAKCDRLNMLKHSTALPYVFTEEGPSTGSGTNMIADCGFNYGTNTSKSEVL